MPKEEVKKVIDLEEMHSVVVNKIQSLRKIAYELEMKIAESEAHLQKLENPDNMIKQIDSSVQLCQITSQSEQMLKLFDEKDIHVELCDGIEIIGRDF